MAWEIPELNGGFNGQSSSHMFDYQRVAMAGGLHFEVILVWIHIFSWTYTVYSQFDLFRYSILTQNIPRLLIFRAQFEGNRNTLCIIHIRVIVFPLRKYGSEARYLCAMFADGATCRLAAAAFSQLCGVPVTTSENFVQN